MSEQTAITLYGVGDCGPIHEPLDRFSAPVRELITSGDIRFAQCEKIYSTRGSMQVHSSGHYSRQHPKMAQVFWDCAFNVVSVAGNHSMDWGPDALLDTIEMFRDRGVKTVGGGENEAAAREPAILEVDGVRVGFLGYCSVLRDGYAATEHAAGCAALRAKTFYEPIEYQPGTPPRVITIPDQEDLAKAVADVHALRSQVDVVVVSMHWGIHIIPKVIADYERTIARAMFAAGADLILGHHPHIPKGIEVIDGKVCFYSLSHFMFSADSKPRFGHRNGHRYGVDMDPAYPHLPFGRDGQRTLVAKALLSSSGVEEVAFLPTRIDTENRPIVLGGDDVAFKEELDYLEWASSELPHTFTVRNDEVLVN